MIRKIGKVGLKWQRTRREWFKQNPAASYNCYYCGRFLHLEETTLDHFHPRGSHPHLRFELSNLVPCCFTCNSLKGSIDGDKFVAQSTTE